MATGSVFVLFGWKWTVVLVLALVAVVFFEGAYQVWDEAAAQLERTIAELRELNPSFVSVTWDIFWIII